MKPIGVDLSSDGETSVHGNCNGGIVSRDAKHDAYFCENCGWLEPKCGDPKCEFCKDRPDKPKGVHI